MLTAARRVALPLYGLPELRDAKATFWRALSVEFTRAGGESAPDTLDFDQPTVPDRIEPSMFLTQLCGYPLQKLFRSQVEVLAAPVYSAPYCDGATHCGVFVVHHESPYQQLADLHNVRFIFGGRYSNSGMNLPRRAIAAIAAASSFFASAFETESQVGNLDQVARGEADATCVDCVTLALAVKHRPQIADSTRVLAITPRSPTIPFVTSAATDPATARRLRRALVEVGSASRWADARAGLLIDAITPMALSDYDCLLDYEHESIALGYPALR